MGEMSDEFFDDLDRIDYDDDFDAHERPHATRGVFKGLSSPIEGDDPVWVPAEGEPLHVSAFGNNHLDNVVRWIERRTDPHPQREAWLDIFKREQWRRFEKMLDEPAVDDDPFKARIRRLEID